MAQSKAKKKRKYLLRNDGKDVERERGKVTFSTHERITKTKKENLEKQMNKHKKHFHEDREHL